VQSIFVSTISSTDPDHVISRLESGRDILAQRFELAQSQGGILRNIICTL